MGKPVEDATTTVHFPVDGVYSIFVRTKDWVARWAAEGSPGKFQLIIDGKPLPELFGTTGADWFWQKGGQVEIKGKKAIVSLHDLTGFDGRCDAIIFTNEPDYILQNDSIPMLTGELNLRERIKLRMQAL